MKSRIDYFLIAKHLIQYVRKADIQASIAPDHKLVLLSIQWENNQYVDRVFGNLIIVCLKMKIIIIQLIQNTYPEFQRKYSYVQDKQILWELLKMEIRISTISFCKGRAKINRRREISIKNQLDQHDEKICASDDALTLDEELKQYDNLKKELQTLYDVKGEAAKFRSKCLWVEQGERPTKYFFNLEKRNYNKRVISELEDDWESSG